MRLKINILRKLRHFERAIEKARFIQFRSIKKKKLWNQKELFNQLAEEYQELNQSYAFSDEVKDEEKEEEHISR